MKFILKSKYFSDDIYSYSCELFEFVSFKDQKYENYPQHIHCKKCSHPFCIINLYKPSTIIPLKFNIYNQSILLNIINDTKHNQTIWALQNLQSNIQSTKQLANHFLLVNQL